MIKIYKIVTSGNPINPYTAESSAILLKFKESKCITNEKIDSLYRKYYMYQHKNLYRLIPNRINNV